jgi:hypothetical protein
MLFATLGLTTHAVNKDSGLETVTDEDLVSLIQTEKHVVVVFSKYIFDSIMIAV